MFDHSRLTRRDSLLLRVAMGVLMMGVGYLIVCMQALTLNSILTDETIPGHAVPVQTSANCFRVDWTELDNDGRPFVPFDANRDGMIDCDSDTELGS